VFKHYLNTAIRYLFRNRGLTLINIIGLAIGICVFILIMHYVRNELSYDKFLSRQDNLTRIEFSDANSSSAWTTSAMGYDLVQAVPEARSSVRFKFRGDMYLEYDKTKYNVSSVVFADSNVFRLFDLELISGDPVTALKEPATVVLTESLAKRIFGEEEAVGQVLVSASGRDLLVTGVMKDPPNNHLRFNLLLSYVTLGAMYGEEHLYNYKTYQYITYVELEEKARLDSVNAKVDRFFHEKFHEIGEDSDEEDDQWIAYLRPVKEVYFARNIRDVGTRHGNRQFVTIFIMIAVFIILIACINFINISTARAATRAKEVGIKKVAGSGRGRLIAQFLSESILITLIATLLGVLLVELVFKEFENIVGDPLQVGYLTNPVNLLLLLGGTVLLGLAAGLYPAFYLTAFQPVSVLKKEKTSGRSASVLRKILIIFQFTISVILISGTIVVYRQLQYLRNKDLGFRKEFVVTADLNQEILQRLDVFRENLLKHTQIEKVSFSYTVPGAGDNYESFTLEGVEVGSCVYAIDPDYIPLMGMELKEGRNFSWDLTSDKLNACLINETFARKIDRDSLLGKQFDHPSWYVTAIPSKKIEIIGIVKDFHYKSLRQEIEPLMFVWSEQWTSYVNIRINPGDIDGALAAIQKEWKAISPLYPIEYSFMDENFDRMYRGDQRLARIFRYFAALAIFIAMLGLFGLAAFIAEQRTKEIGIRKVLGATISEVSVLLVKEFTWLIMVASIIAWILAWLWAKNWLQEFAYRMDLDIWIFIVATLIALVIAWITVIYQTLKAANTNPAESLRYE
jgi:putative ABC transport system permease protein